MTLTVMATASRTRPCSSTITAARCFRPELLARRTFRTVHAANNIAPSGAPQTIGGEPSVPPVLQSRREAIRNAKPFSEFLTDSFNRQHDYLRISVTERCNLRCLYCMPEEGVPLSPPAHMLTTPEIFYLSSLFVNQGVTKIRLTGGEPTVRRDIVPLMQQIGSLRSSGLRELALTTNGISLHRKLDAMVEAGLTGVNLSLDTLDPFQFQIMTRRNGFSAVMKSIDRILEMNKLGANVKLKVNCVVMRGMNERDIIPFVEMGREKDIEVRFIEYMPFGGNKWSQGKMISFQEMLDIIRVKYPDLRSVPGHKNDTSKTFAVPGFVGKVGFITSMTNDFCGTCNRLRITSDGNLKVCLHGNAEVSLRDLLRQDNQGEPIDEEAFERIKKIEMDRRDGVLNDVTGSNWGSREQELLQVIGAAVKRKAEKHADMGDLENMQNRPMILIDHARQPQSVYSGLCNTPISQPGYRFKSPHRPWLGHSLSSASYIGAALASPAIPSSVRAFSGTATRNTKSHEKVLRKLESLQLKLKKPSHSPGVIRLQLPWRVLKLAEKEARQLEQHDELKARRLERRDEMKARRLEQRDEMRARRLERRDEMKARRLERHDGMKVRGLEPRDEMKANTRSRIRPELKANLREPYLSSDDEIVGELRNVEKDQRRRETEMLRLLSEESISLVKTCDFDHYYRLYWRIQTANITIDHKHKRVRRAMDRLYKKIGYQSSRRLSDEDLKEVQTMGEEQKDALRAGLRYNYGPTKPLRVYDKDIVTAHSMDGKPFVPTHAIRTKIAELEARIILEKTYPRGHHPFPAQWYLNGPWIEYMNHDEQRLRFELQQRRTMQNETQILKEWKENLEQMETNLVEFKKRLQSRLGMIIDQDSPEEKELWNHIEAHERGKKDDEDSAAQLAKLELVGAEKLRAHMDTLTRNRAEKLKEIAKLRESLAKKRAQRDGEGHSASALETPGFLAEVNDREEQSSAGDVAKRQVVQSNAAQMSGEPKNQLDQTRLGGTESNQAMEDRLQQLKARRAALTREREAKLKQLQSYKLSGTGKRLELDLERLVPRSSQSVEEKVIWPRRESMTPAITPTENLKGYIPPSGFTVIDEDLTININAPTADELKSQITKLIDRLRTRYPRLTTLPYDVSASTNPETLRTWLRILVKKWQTRFDSWTRYNKDRSSQSSNTYYGNVKVDDDIKAVLDQMVEDHELHVEGTQRMAARWQEVFDRKNAMTPNQNPEDNIDWEEWNSSGMGWLGLDQVSEPPAEPESMAANKTSNPISQTPAKPSLARTQVRQYSTSRRHPPSQNRTPTSSPPEPRTTTPTEPSATPSSLPHLTPEGSAHMVSVSTKPHTLRTAIATGTVHFSNPTPLQLIRSNSVKKGDVLSVSRIAGIMAAKKCPDLIPLCHPIMLTHVGVELLPFDAAGSSSSGAHGGITVEAKVQCEGQTGVEMEALSSVVGAALTIVDMCKAVDKGMRIEGVRVVLKEGGRSGTWKDDGWESVM